MSTYARPLTAARLVRGLIIYYMTWSVVMVPLALLRLLGIFNSAVLVRFGLAALVPGLVVLIGVLLYRGGVVDRVIIMLGLVLAWGVVWGLARGNPPGFLLADTASVGIAAGAYTVARQRWAGDLRIDRLVAVFSAAVLAAYVALVILGFLLASTGYRFYFALSSVDLLLPLAFYLATGRRRLSALTLIVILAGGKVGVSLAALFLLALHILARRRVRGAVIVAGAVLALVLLNLVWIFAADLEIERASDFGHFFGKLLVVYNPWRVVQSPEAIWLVLQYLPLEFGGGRIAEAFYALEGLMALEAAPLLTGGGHGFSYDMWYLGMFRPDARNVHLSPISMLVRYGLLLAIVFYSAIFGVIGRSYRDLLARPAAPVEWTMWYFCVGSLVFSLTAFSTFNLTIFWFFLALLAFASARHGGVATRRQLASAR